MKFTVYTAFTERIIARSPEKLGCLFRVVEVIQSGTFSKRKGDFERMKRLKEEYERFQSLLQPASVRHFKSSEIKTLKPDACDRHPFLSQLWPVV